MSRVFLFPGQGSQYVGMGKSLADSYMPARLVFEEVNEALGQNLSEIMWSGPEETLKLTENTQPALMAHSMAVMRVLEDGGVDIAKVASHVAGHSLGEYSALCAAKAFTLADTARLLKIRGQAMQRAVPVGEGAMAAIIGLDLEVVEKVVAEAAVDGVVVSANDNAPGQVVVSGEKVAVEKAIVLAKEQGAKMGMLLPVSAPFHCPLMQPAADAMEQALSQVTIAAPVVPVISNVEAKPITDPAVIKDLLVQQVTGVVRWRESVLTMPSLGIDQAVELGAGKVLCGLLKRIDRSLSSLSIQEPEDIDAFVASL